MIECLACGVSQPSEAFRQKRPKCRACERAECRAWSRNNREKRNARLRRWRRANPDKAKAYDRRGRLKKAYGITPEQATKLLESNAGLCWICNDQKSTCIDHDHKTGAVRGALCLSCNTFLGRIEKNPRILSALRSYGYQPCHADILLELANAPELTNG